MSIPPERRRAILRRLTGEAEGEIPSADEAAKDATARRVLLKHLQARWLHIQEIERTLSAYKRDLWDLLNALDEEKTKPNKTV